MPVNKPIQTPRVEPRWPAALSIVIVLFLLMVLPGRVRLFPAWVPYAIVVATIAPMAALQLTGARAPWPRVERAVLLLLFVAVGMSTIVTLAILIRAMVRGAGGLSGMQLLTSSIGVWVSNIMIFSLLYWQIDCGGPEERAKGTDRSPDWVFPGHDAPPTTDAGWHPAFVDYLFLGFTTATAFSPTEAMPMTGRAKLLMMLESAISLSTIVVVAARAINILGG